MQMQLRHACNNGVEAAMALAFTFQLGSIELPTAVGLLCLYSHVTFHEIGDIWSPEPCYTGGADQE